MEQQKEIRGNNKSSYFQIQTLNHIINWKTVENFKQFVINFAFTANFKSCIFDMSQF